MTLTNIFNQDFQDLIHEFNENNVEYILVGGYLVIIHGYNRTNGDLELWVNPTESNFEKMRKAFSNFGLPTDAIVKENFLNTDDFDVFTFGVSPVSVDILTKLKGLKFSKAFEHSIMYQIEEHLMVRGLSKSHLIDAKKSAGRNKDLDDLEHLINA